MIVREVNDALIIDGIKDFDTDHIFDCGQCFRWEKNENGRYFGIAYGKLAEIEYDDEKEVLTIYGADAKSFEEVWEHYLDLDRDYGKIKSILSEKDDVIADAIRYGSGIRILNQEKWETLISFIISQNNNIPRIKKCIDSLAETLGEKVGTLNGKVFYELPTPKRLSEATLDDLTPCKLGYRAKYLIETAKQVNEEGIDSLERLGNSDVSSEEAFETLKRYCGVGPKVANCIALFSMEKTDRFPIDVWVRKVMNRLYGIDESDMKKMAEFAADKFGQLGGIAQQYLFYYITHNKV